MSCCYCCSVAKSCPTPCDLMDCSTPGFPVLHHLLELLKLMSIESVMPFNHLILCHSLLLLPSIFPSIRVFSNESAFCIRWPKYWSASFSISPSNQYSGLISFRIEWFDLLALQGTLKSLLTIQKHQFFSAQPSLWWYYNCPHFTEEETGHREVLGLSYATFVSGHTWSEHTAICAAGSQIHNNKKT